MSFRPLALMSVAGVFALAACGGGSDSSEPTVRSDAGLLVSAIEGIKWDKTEYTAVAGAVEVAVTNDSSLPHDLRFVDASGTQLPADLEIPSRNDVAVETVTLEAGTYTLICTIAGHTNMRATLTVS